MVGRELQKIRPYGEDHQGLVPVRGKAAVVSTRNGKRIDVLKN